MRKISSPQRQSPRRSRTLSKETGKLPKLIMIDHFDYQFANEHDVYGIGKVAKEYGIPFLYNGAYTVGVMPVDGKKIGADFIVGSGHKSMASAAPSGVLATTDEWAPKVFRTTQMVGDLTERKFGVKEVENMGCTLMGATLLSMIASFPRVQERTAALGRGGPKVQLLPGAVLAHLRAQRF